MSSALVLILLVLLPASLELPTRSRPKSRIPRLRTPHPRLLPRPCPSSTSRLRRCRPRKPSQDPRRVRLGRRNVEKFEREHAVGAGGGCWGRETTPNGGDHRGTVACRARTAREVRLDGLLWLEHCERDVVCHAVTDAVHRGERAASEGQDVDELARERQVCIGHACPSLAAVAVVQCRCVGDPARAMLTVRQFRHPRRRSVPTQSSSRRREQRI